MPHEIGVLIFTCFYGLAPAYLFDLISVHKPARNIRSTKALLLSPVASNFVRLGELFDLCTKIIFKKSLAT